MSTLSRQFPLTDPQNRVAPTKIANTRVSDTRVIGTRVGFGPSVRWPVRGLLDVVLAWQGRANERWALAQLDERALKDLGLRPDQVARETAKPFWRV